MGIPTEQVVDLQPDRTSCLGCEILQAGSYQQGHAPRVTWLPPFNGYPAMRSTMHQPQQRKVTSPLLSVPVELQNSSDVLKYHRVPCSTWTQSAREGTQGRAPRRSPRPEPRGRGRGGGWSRRWPRGRGRPGPCHRCPCWSSPEGPWWVAPPAPPVPCPLPAAPPACLRCGTPAANHASVMLHSMTISSADASAEPSWYHNRSLCSLFVRKHPCLSTYVSLAANSPSLKIVTHPFLSGFLKVSYGPG